VKEPAFNSFQAFIEARRKDAPTGLKIFA